MGVVAVLLVVVAGLGVAGGVGVLVVDRNHPDRVVELQQQKEPEVLVYGKR